MMMMMFHDAYTNCLYMFVGAAAYRLLQYVAIQISYLLPTLATTMKLALGLFVIVISVSSICAARLRGSQEVQWQDANIAEGLYKIKTTHHGPGGQPAGWGLSTWHAHDGYRNSASSWVYVHDGNTWPMTWKIVKGKKPNTYRLLTTNHVHGRQVAGWGLSAWHGHGARRNSASSWIAVHSGDYWPMDWRIVKGAK